MDASTSPRVAAVFERRTDADEAIADLMTEGFSQDQIRLALSGSPAAAGEKPEPDQPGGVMPGLLSPSGTYGTIGGGYPVTLNTLPAGIVTLNLADADVAFFTKSMGPGKALVVVDAGARADIARVILERNGGKSRP